MTPNELMSDVEERIDTRVAHPNPTAGGLRTWLEGLPFKPDKVTVTLPPRDRKSPSSNVHHLRREFAVTVRDQPSPDGRILAVLKVEAESAAHARHFGARLFQARHRDHPEVYWIRAELAHA